MDLIVERSKQLLADKGPLSIGFYTSGQLFLEEYYTLAVIGKAGIGTPHMDGNTRLCTATAAAALKETFGTDGQPGSLHRHRPLPTRSPSRPQRRRDADGPVERGCSTARRARTRRELIVVDPRPTPVAREADLHLPSAAAPTSPCSTRILHELIANGWIDLDYIGRAHRRLRRAARVGRGLPARARRRDLRGRRPTTSARRPG